MATENSFKKFSEDGYVVLESFLSQEDVDALKRQCRELVDEMDPDEHQTVFSTTKQSHRNTYFLDSADNISYFFEDGARDEKGNLTTEKHLALNKIGHALHVWSPDFKRVTHSAKVKNIARKFGLQKPTVCQSMYIFKQPHMGGEVVPHQDATFLHTNPVQGVIGFWIALEDATLENGCLWFIPGSHKNGIDGDYQMVRNPDPEAVQTCMFLGEKPTYEQDRFVAAPVKAGDCILIDALVVHKSERNLSAASRHIYTFHMFDPKQGKWDERNWLQHTEKGTFTDLYTTEA